MNKLKSKLKSKKGFTLIEMLIVVAIIAILVAIAVPVVNASLDNAKKQTDAANERTAKIVAAAGLANGDITPGTYYFNESKGEFDTKENAYEAQGSDNEGKILQVGVSADGTITTTWASK